MHTNPGQPSPGIEPDLIKCCLLLLIFFCQTFVMYIAAWKVDIALKSGSSPFVQDGNRELKSNTEYHIDCYYHGWEHVHLVLTEYVLFLLTCKMYMSLPVRLPPHFKSKEWGFQIYFVPATYAIITHRARHIEWGLVKYLCRPSTVINRYAYPKFIFLIIKIDHYDGTAGRNQLIPITHLKSSLLEDLVFPSGPVEHTSPKYFPRLAQSFTCYSVDLYLFSWMRLQGYSNSS